MAEDYYQHHAGVAQGLSGLKAYMGEQFQAMPDLEVTIEDTICQGDRAVARVTNRGTRDGRRFHGEIIDLWRIEDGKLAEHWSGDPVYTAEA